MCSSRWCGTTRTSWNRDCMDVCPVPHGANGSESESDGEVVVAVVELHQVEEDDLE